MHIYFPLNPVLTPRLEDEDPIFIWTQYICTILWKNVLDLDVFMKELSYKEFEQEAYSMTNLMCKYI